MIDPNIYTFYVQVTTIIKVVVQFCLVCYIYSTWRGITSTQTIRTHRCHNEIVP